MNTQRIQFPLLDKVISGHKLVYFDNAATTPKPESVINAISYHYQLHNGNPGRGTHQLASDSLSVVDHARKATLDFINAPATQTVIFTKNCTESINTVAHILRSKYRDVGQKPTIIITQAEHHSNYLPWLRLTEEEGFELIIVPILPTGTIDYDFLENAITNNSSAFVAITHISNVTGIVTDISRVSTLCQKAGAQLLIDAAQSFAHLPIDLTKTPCTYLVASAHKAYGPEGVGILVLPKVDLTEGSPILLGGGTLLKVENIDYQLKTDEERFEAGTQNIAGLAGLIEALSFIKNTTLEAIGKQEQELTTYFLQKLTASSLPIRLIATPQHPIFSFISKVHPHDIADYLDEQGIAVRSGNHCAQPLHQALGVIASTRVSLSFYNTSEEIDYLFDVLSACIKRFA
jgi:cysteine desulfurase/selenocysteine lyase